MIRKSPELPYIHPLTSHLRQLPRPFLVTNGNDQPPVIRYYSQDKLNQMRSMGYTVTPTLVSEGIISVIPIPNSTVGCEICEDLVDSDSHHGPFPATYRVNYPHGHYRMVCNFHLPSDLNQKS